MGNASDIVRFGEFELDRSDRRLLRGGEPVELGSRYFDALVLLVENSGALVTKDEFMDRVWQGIPVTDEALTQCIRTLRRALGDDAANPRFIATVPKHGYRFLANPVVETATNGLPLSRVAGASTIGGLAAGALAGLVYGALASTAGGAGALILSAMIGALGLLAGAGVGCGMAAAMALRGRIDATVIAGGAVGGMAIGALGNLLGREGVGLLTGIPAIQATGPFEGLLIGTACGIAAWLSLMKRPALYVVGAALLSGLASGALIHFSGGTLLAASLASLQSELPDARLAMERFMQFPLLTTMVESAAFALGIAAALLAAGRPR